MERIITLLMPRGRLLSMHLIIRHHASRNALPDSPSRLRIMPFSTPSSTLGKALLILSFAENDAKQRKDKKRAWHDCRVLSLHCRQFSPNGMNRVEDQGHSSFTGIFLAAYILCHQALRDAHASCQCRHIQFGMCHEELIKSCRFLFFKETLKTQIFIQFFPMDSKFICREINKLFFCGITQTRIVCKEFASFLTFVGSNPYGCVRQPNFYYFHLCKNR